MALTVLEVGPFLMEQIMSGQEDRIRAAREKTGNGCELPEALAGENVEALALQSVVAIKGAAIEDLRSELAATRAERDRWLKRVKLLESREELHRAALAHRGDV